MSLKNINSFDLPENKRYKYLMGVDKMGTRYVD